MQLNFSIPLRWKLYGLIAVAFTMGIFGVRSMWVAEGEAKIRAKMERQREKAIEEATEIRNEVEALDRDTLRDRASQWVRGHQR